MYSKKIMTLESKQFANLVLSKIEDVALAESCIDLVNNIPAVKETLVRLIHYFSPSRKQDPTKEPEEKAVKKRRLENSDNPSHPNDNVLCIIHDLSFQMPRRKGHLVSFSNHFEVICNGSTEAALNYSDVASVFLFPTPGKIQQSSTVLIYSKSGKSNIMFCFPTIATEATSLDIKITEVSIVEREFMKNDELIEHIIAKTVNFACEKPDPLDFISKFPSVHKSGSNTNNQLQLYASCYLKAKEGQLYFLKSGIFFGLKKPSFFLLHDSITKVALENLTTRTFNIKIHYRVKKEENLIVETFGNKKSRKDVVIEFDMIDNCEFEPLMSYLKKYSLDDIEVSSCHASNMNPRSPIKSLISGEAETNMFSNENYRESEDEDFEINSSDLSSSTSLSDEESDDQSLKHSSEESDISLDEDEDSADDSE